jgi:hypothetical protein
MALDELELLELEFVALEDELLELDELLLDEDEMLELGEFELLGLDELLLDEGQLLEFDDDWLEVPELPEEPLGMGLGSKAAAASSGLASAEVCVAGQLKENFLAYENSSRKRRPSR